MALRKHDSLELTIEKTAFGGMGIGRMDGFVIFVKGGVPEDRLTVQVFKKKRDFANAKILEILSPSPERTAAPCPYFGYCGGCQWQHVRYNSQLAYKKSHIEESLRHIGGLENIVLHDVIPSENRFAYRNKMEFSFSDRRWFLPEELSLKKSQSGFALGLHVPGTFNKVIDMEACLLQKEKGNEILRLVKKYAKKSGLPVHAQKTHQGFWRFLTIRYSDAFDQWMVNIVTSEENRRALQPLAEKLTDNQTAVRSVVNNITGKRASVAVGDREILLSGTPCIDDKIGPYRFQISANSFFQTNTRGAYRLYQTVAAYAELSGDEIVLDLYSGTGTIPVFLASRARQVIGMEINESAVADAYKNCELNRIGNCRFMRGDIRDMLPVIHEKPDVLILDPPRAGMHKDVLACVLSMAPEKIVYVSCNPATLARDLGQMIGHYRIQEIQPVDMFPHTYHIEAVAKLVRR